MVFLKGRYCPFKISRRFVLSTAKKNVTYSILGAHSQGRLVLGDGSRYYGMWHYGKRSGSGTFYFSNGDVFQGSWRDDFMHGKVWSFGYFIKKFHNSWLVHFLLLQFVKLAML